MAYRTFGPSFTIPAVNIPNDGYTVGPAGSNANYICNGIADEVEINQAITDVNAAGGGKVILLAGAYSVDSSIIMKSKVCLSGISLGAVKIIASTSFNYTSNRATIIAQGTETTGNAITVSANINSGDNIITVTNNADVTALVQNEYCVLISEHLWETITDTSGRKVGEMVKVYAKTATTISLYGTTKADYNIADNARLYRMNFLQDILIENLEITQASPIETISNAGNAILLMKTFNTVVRNCKLHARDGAGVGIYHSVNTCVTNNFIYDLTDDPGSNFYGYGVVQGGASEQCIISNNIFDRLRHGYTSGPPLIPSNILTNYGIARNTLISNNVVSHCTNSGLDTHGQSDGVSIINNTITACDTWAIFTRGRGTHIVGNTMEWCGSGVSVGISQQSSGSSGSGTMVLSNTIRHMKALSSETTNGTITTNGVGIQVIQTDNVTVANNTIEATDAQGILVGTACKNNLFQNNTILNANISNGASTGAIGLISSFNNSTFSIDSVASNIVTVSYSGTGITSSYLPGQNVVVSGAANASNNGTFIISEIVSTSSLKYTNASAIFPDANSGSITVRIEGSTDNTFINNIAINATSIYDFDVDGYARYLIYDAGFSGAGGNSRNVFKNNTGIGMVSGIVNAQNPLSFFAGNSNSESTPVKSKAGIPTDADFKTAPPAGSLAVDTTNNVLYFRDSSTWRSVFSPNQDIIWDTGFSPTLTQANTATTGNNLNIRSQSSTGANAGNLILAVGTSLTVDASRTIHLNEGTNSAIRFQINPTAASTMSIQPGVTSFAIQHNSTAVATGATFNISAQSTTGDGYNGGLISITGGSATGTTGTGGDITLSAGTGPTANGKISFRLGVNSALQINPVNHLGTTTLTFVNTVTAANINQTSTNIASATGAPLTIQAQDATGSTSIGGSLNLTSGTGTSLAGSVLIKTGGTTRVTVSPTLVTLQSLAGSGSGLVAVDNSGNLSFASGTASGNVKDFGALGNGTTDDTVAIQAAFSSGYSSIIFPDGVYIATALTITTSKKLTGTGTIKQKASTTGDLFTISGTSTIVSVEGLTIDGNEQNQITATDNKSIYFTALGTASAPAGLNVYNCTFINGGWADISVRGDAVRSTNEWLSVNSSRFWAGREGTSSVYAPRYIDIRSPINYVISGNNFDRLTSPSVFGRAGIIVYDGFSSTFENARGIISNNVLNKVGRSQSISTLGAIDLYDSGRSTSVIGNTLTDSYGRGIQSKCDGYALSIVGNTIDGLLGGSDATTAAQIVINGAVASHPTARGSFTISSNTCINSDKDGISVTGDGYSVSTDGYTKNIVITNNSIKNANRRGIGVITVVDITVSNNAVSGAVEGIYFDNIRSSINCTGNTVTDQSGNGIDVISTNTSAVVNIGRNVVTGQTNKGIVVSAGTIGIVSNNIVSNTGSSAIFISNTTGNFRVVENQGTIVDGGSNTDLFLGTAITIGGDLGGTSTSQIVKSITGNAGTVAIATTGANLQWASGTVLPTLSQATLASGTGAALTIQAQNVSAGTGGALSLTSGSGSTVAGNVVLNTGGTPRVTVSPTQTTFADTSTAITIVPLSTGNSAITFASTVGACRIDQTASTTASGAFMSIISQSTSLDGGTAGPVSIAAGSATGTTGTGGAIDIRTGTGTTNGMINFRLGNTTFAQWRNLSATTANLQWVSTQIPVINQADLTTNSATAAPFTIQAQNATGTSSSGGSLLLNAGTGTTTGGLISLRPGCIPGLANSSSFVRVLDGYTGSIALNITPNSNSFTLISFGSTVTAAQINQSDLTTNSATAATFTLQAQNTTGTSAIAGALTLSAGTASGGSSTGGSVNINAGTGTTNGLINIQRGGVSALSITPNATGTTSLTFASTVTSLQWTQSTTSIAAGAVTTFTAQSTSLDGANGGNIVLQSGSSTGATTGIGGFVRLQAGTGTTGNGGVTFQLGTGLVATFTPNPTGASGLSFVDTVTSVGMSQNPATVTNGATWGYSAQSTSLAGGSGGNMAINAGNATGTGSTTGGLVRINAGSGATNGTIAFGLAGITALSFVPNTTGAITWSYISTVTSVSFQQTTTTVSNGANWNMQAQHTTRTDGVAATGGNLTLTAGSATGVNAASNTGGNVIIDSGSAASSSTSNTLGSILFRNAGTTALTLAPIPTGATSLTYASTVTAVSLQQTSSTTANGAPWTISSQSTSFNGGTAGALNLNSGNATGTTSTGGDIVITPGSGTTTFGMINLRSNLIRYEPAPSVTGSVTQQFSSIVTSAIWNQAATALTSGANWSFAAQSTSFGTGTVTGGQLTLTAGNATGAATSNTGGSVNISSGSASNATTNTPGNITLQTGGVTRFTITPTEARFADTGTAITILPVATGSSTIQVASTVTGFNINQAASTTGVGASWNITAQGTSADTFNGGNLTVASGTATGTSGSGGILILSAGTGPTANGTIRFRAGSTDALTINPVNPTGATTINIVSTVTAFDFSQTTTAATSGAPFTITAQRTSFDGGTGGSLTLSGGNGVGATTGTGGSVNLNVGSGTTVGGAVNFQRNSSTAFTYTPNPTGTNIMQFVSGVTSVQFNIASTAAANGTPITIQAQSTSFDTGIGGTVSVTAGNSTGATTGTGGIVRLIAGTGTTANGSITFQLGVSNAATFTPVPTGSSSFAFSPSVTAANIIQSDLTTNGATGAVLVLQAQNATGTTSTGGGLSLRAGTGTSTNGTIRFGAASADAVRMGIVPTGASTFTIQAPVTSYIFGWNSTTTASGGALAITGQSTTFDGGTGGSVTINAGSGNGATTGTGGSININAASGTTTNGVINFQRNGTTSLTYTPNISSTATLQFTSGITAAVVNQADNTTNGATAAPTTLQAQNATGTTSTGGSLNLTSGTGTTAAGNVNIQAGGTTIASITSNKLISSKGRRHNVTTITGTYTVLVSDEFVVVTANSAPFTVTLPASATSGDVYEIKDAVGNAATNNITVSGNGSNIDGSATYAINVNYSSLTVAYTGTEWSIL